MTPVRTVTYVKYTPVPMPAPPTRAAESGFESLFNGKDLTGWKASANPESFKVANGAIVANAVGQASHLFYDGPVGNHAFQDFDLRLDVLARYRSNGGVYVMTEFQPQEFPGRASRAHRRWLASRRCGGESDVRELRRGVDASLPKPARRSPPRCELTTGWSPEAG